MSDHLRREAEELKDEKAEKQSALKIRELNDSAPGELSQGLIHLQEQHILNLKKENEERQKFEKRVGEMKQEEEEEHRANILERIKLAESQSQDNSIRCDAVTQVALERMKEARLKLEAEARQREQEIVEAKAKTAVIEVDVTKRVFDEVDAQKDKDEFLSERRAQELFDQHADIQKEEELVSANERAQKKENAKMTIAEIRSDLRDQQTMGMYNLNIQQSADDKKNRRQINAKIMDVKTLLEELDRWFERTAGVLNAPPELYEKLKRNKRIATKSHLARFSEILSSISTRLSEIEQNLALLELEDVQMNEVIRNIKTQISSFGEVIANLKLTLELDGIPIDPTKSGEFSELKKSLFVAINEMELVPENRDVIKQQIQERQIEAMPQIETLAIQN
ncbi:hypothetical protein GCK72_018919 [Caenorhabditis remanei]|uniref:Uncharacterized protein n=1 Tax=Caenorhabditis remanei TaxID=31234 RepID=A0A6A5GCL7_CAERE|nr:hypothetical protein GCK72_018919 [Caenorhabditis remanei]KAF1752365.1 hypothetical protein GCK72_018919 [Caenorhabditis remanei]